jgi:CRP-like cAMP-binding protein
MGVFVKKKMNLKQRIKTSVKRNTTAPFDPKIFLAKASRGKSISKYSKDRPSFSQGQAADAVFYIQKGKVKLTVVSKQGKEAVSQSWNQAPFLAKEA